MKRLQGKREGKGAESILHNYGIHGRSPRLAPLNHELYLRAFDIGPPLSRAGNEDIKLQYLRFASHCSIVTFFGRAPCQFLSYFERMKRRNFCGAAPSNSIETNLDIFTLQRRIEKKRSESFLADSGCGRFFCFLSGFEAHLES